MAIVAGADRRHRRETPRTQSSTYVPRSAIAFSAGARAGRHRALDHRRLHAVDDGQDELGLGALTAGCAGRRTSRPRGACRRAAGRRRSRARRPRSARRRPPAPASSTRGALEVDRQRAARLGVQARAHARHERARRGAPRARRTGRPPSRPGHQTSVWSASVAGEQQRAEADADALQRRLERSRSATPAALRDDGGDAARARRRAASRAARGTQNGVPSKSIADVRGRQRARDERRQERAGCPRRRRDRRPGECRSAVATRPVPWGRMTIDDRDARPPGEPRPMTPRPGRRQTSRDLERYAGLFAARTKVMRSSAMRDLMALTERSDIISLAGGLPDTSSFPAESLRRDHERASPSTRCARSLQYGPTEGLDRAQALHRRGHGRGGHARSTPTTCSSRPAASRSSTSSARR